MLLFLSHLNIIVTCVFYLLEGGVSSWIQRERETETDGHEYSIIAVDKPQLLYLYNVFLKKTCDLLVLASF